MFRLEEERLGADLQDGRLLQRSGDGEQSELRGNQRPVLRHSVLTLEELQAAVEVQGLKTNTQIRTRGFRAGSTLLVKAAVRYNSGVCYQEAGGVVEQAAETTAEVSLQEGRVK